MRGISAPPMVFHPPPPGVIAFADKRAGAAWLFAEAERAPRACTRIPAVQMPLEPAWMLIRLIGFPLYEKHMIPDGLARTAAA